MARPWLSWGRDSSDLSPPHRSPNLSSATKPLRLTPEAVDALVDELLDASDAAYEQGRRYILGVAGIAGSGKSTLAARLVDACNKKRDIHPAVFIPMDGFHFPNHTLERQNWTQRKGAPFTYDANAYLALLERYRSAEEVGDYPVYDRHVHEPVPSKTPVTAQTRLLITEGQYLLLDQYPWSRLTDILDAGWWLDTPTGTARRWVINRHIQTGRTPERARQKYIENDAINTQLVLKNRRKPDLIVQW
jgi:pantothenate kinase